MDIGKHGKRLGLPHPRDLKRKAEDRDKPTPLRRRSEKPRFGIQYNFQIFRSTRQCQHWYTSAKARDQALDAHNSKYAFSDVVSKASPVRR